MTEIKKFEWPTDPEMLESLLTVRTLANNDEYMKSWHESNDYEPAEGLFEDEDTDDSMSTPDVDIVLNEHHIIWATGDDEHGFNEEVTPDDLSCILTRTQKSAEARKARTKVKAEVFTPSWVCSLQNDMADDYMMGGEGIFGKAEKGIWTPSKKKVKFKNLEDRLKFIISKRLEITCGEAPYIVQRYDATTGAEIPVIDEKGRYARSGFLDRKLRVISECKELASDSETWRETAMLALKATYGYEWQGDNLLIARYNVVNDIIEWHHALFDEKPDDDYLRALYAVVSWNLWQMDGLKQTTPMTCSDGCKACKNKDYYGHDGELPVIAWWSPVSEDETPTRDEMIAYACMLEFNSVRKKD